MWSSKFFSGKSFCSKCEIMRLGLHNCRCAHQMRGGPGSLRIINALSPLFPMTQCLYDLSFTEHLKALLSSVFNLPSVTTFYF